MFVVKRFLDLNFPPFKLTIIYSTCDVCVQLDKTITKLSSFLILNYLKIKF